MSNPCENCTNEKCANSLVAFWWDECVKSGFTLFPQKEAATKEGEPHE